MTIDDDVAAILQRLRRTRDARFKNLINEALRRGLREMSAQPKRREPFRTRTVSVGSPKIASIDNIAEVIAIAEGETFK